ncbi:uncharacterized protein LOC108819707 [Raphanus sativus]|uniref:Uncharacterized protein LOC108819707 n=1 Tax=Raphanus sativus TaxID=3726 RepID=A0A6J0KKZ0_RAPSA|nr:uncharacterized protein LOC108819707 [Raphanus sativus]
MPPPTQERGADTFLWRNEAGHYVHKFSVKATWNLVRERAPLVSWQSLIWFKEGIPRCSFVSWMVALSRLPTRDRLIAWGMNVPALCVLCPSGHESHQHLFFQCPFVSRIWAPYCGNYGLSVPSSLDAVASLLALPRVCEIPGLKVVLKILLQAIIYCSWRERNLRIFQQTPSTEAGVRAQVHLSCPRPHCYHSATDSYFVSAAGVSLAVTLRYICLIRASATAFYLTVDISKLLDNLP